MSRLTSRLRRWGTGYGLFVLVFALFALVLGVDCDGAVGSKTLAALNSRNPRELFADLKRERLAFIDRICQTRPANKKFRKGWINRIEALKYVG